MSLSLVEKGKGWPKFWSDLGARRSIWGLIFMSQGAAAVYLVIHPPSSRQELKLQTLQRVTPWWIAGWVWPPARRGLVAATQLADSGACLLLRIHVARFSSH